MVKTENHCVGCEVCGSCGADKTTVYYCDCCNEEVETLEQFAGEQLCDECVKEKVKNDFVDDILGDYDIWQSVRDYLGIRRVV